MNREDILRHVGSMQQLASVRRIEYCEGRSKSLGAVEVRNGPLRFVAMVDKCLDISELSYRGMQLNFLSKPGLNGRNHFDTNGEEALRSIMGGLFFTCGLENICAPYTSAHGREYPMHGRMRTTPAEHLCADAHWSGEDYVMEVSGEMREAELFGENLVLRRRISTVFGRNEVRIEDELVNEGFRSEPAMLMYHCNFGFPFLREGSRLILPTRKMVPRDAISMPHTGEHAVMGPPKDGEPEYVFLHELASDANGDTFAAIVDARNELAVRLGFNRRQLPYFMEWKSTASGDYVIGLEPSNSSVYGRAWHETRGDLYHIPAQAAIRTTIAFSIEEGREAIKALEVQKDELMRQEESS